MKDDHEGCTPCVCFGVDEDDNPTYPRSTVWDYVPNKYGLHYNRRSTGHKIVQGAYIDALKHIWMDIGVFGCPKEIGTKNYGVTDNPYRDAYSNKSNY